MGVVADGIVPVSGRNGSAAAYSADNGRRLWSRDLGLDSAEVRRRGRVQVPGSPVEAGVAPS
ncbi:hypothetical protein ACLGIH_02020 [Streptomyces sp. HMX87]|uniref:hypothetical protein n=1 Tax=Streptomyces sp. HMX87 TaxID=3390849 RepID=UPI003A83E90F